MDERDHDIAMVEVIAANDALEQEWRDSLAGRRAKGKDGSDLGKRGGYDSGASNGGLNDIGPGGNGVAQPIPA